MTRALLRRGRSRLFFRRGGRPHCGVGEFEPSGLRHAVGQLLLHRIAYRDPAALYAGHRAFDEDEPALEVGLHDLQIERGHAVDAQMARHFLVLEGLSGILTATGGADRAVRNGDAVAGA